MVRSLTQLSDDVQQGRVEEGGEGQCGQAEERKSVHERI